MPYFKKVLPGLVFMVDSLVLMLDTLLQTAGGAGTSRDGGGVRCFRSNGHQNRNVATPPQKEKYHYCSTKQETAAVIGRGA